ARLVQEKLGTPMASLLLQPGLVPSNIAPPQMPGGLSIPSWTPRMLRPAYWLGVDLFGYAILGRALNRMRAELRLTPVRRFFRWWLSPDLVIGAFPSWYAQSQSDWPRQMKLCGFTRFDGVKGDLPNDVREFCKQGCAPIAFTLGTGMEHAREFFKLATEACRLLDSPGVLLTKFSKVLPTNLPSTVLHCPFAPFRRLLPLCSAIVHHGGIGTTAASLEAGCPQLILPLAWDQPDNAARIRQLGVGLSLGPRQRSSSEITAALQRLKTKRVGEQCQVIATLLANDIGAERSATVIEEFAIQSSVFRGQPTTS
ncbi:MAG: nucleotide disphospho-sugar-binding domain-containing protein, partial [Aureliella sp.]